MPTRVKLRSIPPANRTPGSLAVVARHGKPMRSAAQGTESTSFKPHVVLPDPKLKAARENLYRAIRERVADLERLIQQAADPGEAQYWERLLQRLRE